MDALPHALPCPFCGGPPAYMAQCLDEGAWKHPMVAISNDNGAFIEAWVFCHECGADGPRAEDICYTQADLDALGKQAYENWNRRDERNKRLYDANVARLSEAAPAPAKGDGS